MVTEAIAACVRRERWDRAFELILRFGRDDLVETALATAYMPLIRSGHTGTLAAFATKVRVAPTFPPAVVDLAEADIALADGAFELASESPSEQPSDSEMGTSWWPVQRRSLRKAPTPRLSLQMPRLPIRPHTRRLVPTTIGWPRSWMGTLIAPGRGTGSPLGHGATRGSSGPVPSRSRSTFDSRTHPPTFHDRIRRGLLADRRGGSSLDQVDDPRARSSFAHVASYVTALGTHYREAKRWLDICDADISAFDLDFARPHSLWNRAHVALGLVGLATQNARCRNSKIRSTAIHLTSTYSTPGSSADGSRWRLEEGSARLPHSLRSSVRR